jgi:serine/threonine protein kinase
VSDTREQDTLASASPKERTQPLLGNESVQDPFYDPSRDFPDVGARFEILSRIGEGGMGEVFKARDRELDEIVALKVLSPQFETDPSRLDRLKQEVRLARKISSNGVCRIHDLVELPNKIRGIAMEFIEGQTLGELIASNLSVDYLRFAKWAADIAEGLAAAHKLSIIHRDLKPDNIMITTQDRAMILDFGVARHHEGAPENERLTQEGMILGTVPYMAPEQLSNAPLDPRSDLYSLGLILAEMVTGDIPAYGASYHETLTRRVVEPEIYELEHHDPAVPADFAAVVNHLLRSAVEERPFSAKMVADHLRHFSGTEGLSVDGATPERYSSMPPPNRPPSYTNLKPSRPQTSEAPVRPGKPINLVLLSSVAILCVGLALAVAKMTKKEQSPPPQPSAKRMLAPQTKPETVIKAEPTVHKTPVTVEPKVVPKPMPPPRKKRKPKKRKQEKSIPMPEEL